MLERLRFKDRGQKGKATYHDRNERYAFELGSGLISLAEDRVIEMERVHIIKMKD